MCPIKSIVDVRLCFSTSKQANYNLQYVPLKWGNKGTKYLKLTENEWQDIGIEEIKTTDNSDIIFIKCANQEEAAKLTSKAKHLPQDTGPDTPRIIMHIDTRAKKRHQAILAIAKTIREHSKRSVQTTVRAGRMDFLLRQRPKGSMTPWNQIPPEIIRQQLPQ